MRRMLAPAAFIVIAIACLNPVMLRFPFQDRAAMHEAFTAYPDRGIWYPNYIRFLEQVRLRTRPGETIAIAAAVPRWDGGYSYAYYRASYFLAGREVLPLVTPLDHAVPENLVRAQYVAVWRAQVRASRPVVYRGFDGELLGH
jgi:hypothetical protein